MKNLKNLSEQELQSINGGGIFSDWHANISSSISKAVADFESKAKSFLDRLSDRLREIGGKLA